MGMDVVAVASAPAHALYLIMRSYIMWVVFLFSTDRKKNWGQACRLDNS